MPYLEAESGELVNLDQVTLISPIERAPTEDFPDESRFDIIAEFNDGSLDGGFVFLVMDLSEEETAHVMDQIKNTFLRSHSLKGLKMWAQGKVSLFPSQKGNYIDAHA